MEAPPPVYSRLQFVNQSAIEHFECPICTNVVNDAVQCMKGHLYCRSCLEQAMAQTKECPTCKVKVADELISSLLARKVINEAQVYCYTRVPALESAAAENQGSGSSSSSSSSSSDQSAARNVRPRVDQCTWEGKLEDAETHFKECGYAGAKCSHAGCDEVVARRDMAEHEATCQHRTERCGMCGSLEKIAELTQHQLDVCLKRQVDCDNHGCGARVAFDELAAHKASDCGYEEVGCPLADMGCTARMLRKDIDSHEDAALKQHNRLLLGKVKEQQRITLQQQQITLHVRKVCDEQQKAFDELRGAHGELQKEHEELKESRGRLVPQVRYEDITLRVKQAVLTGTEPIAALDPHISARVYSEEKVVQGRTLIMYVEVQNPPPHDCYGVYLLVKNGPAPLKITYTYTTELVHYDGNPRSAMKDESEHTFNAVNEHRRLMFIPKSRLTSPNNNRYVEDGYVTFKCTFKIVE
jgi:hypothetical protein